MCIDLEKLQRWYRLDPCLRNILDQRLANYGRLAKFGLAPAFVNNMLLGHSHLIGLLLSMAASPLPHLPAELSS